MSYDLLLIGYKADLDQADQVLDTYFKDINATMYEIDSLSEDRAAETVDDLNQLCTGAAGILFLRKEIYLFISSHMEFNIPSRYADIDEVTLRLILLRARLGFTEMIKGLSADVFSKAQLLPLLADADIFDDKAEINTIPYFRCVHLSAEEIADYHIENLESGASLALTNFPDVYEILREKRLPVSYVDYAPHSIVQEIRNLKLGVRLHERQERIGYIYICLRYKYTTINLIQVPMRETDELTRISNYINLFARSIDAACVSLSRWEYMILCNESLLLNETNNFLEISLIKKITEESVFDMLMSIGFGKTPKEAYSNSMISYAVSVRLSTSNVVVTFDGKDPETSILYQADGDENTPKEVSIEYDSVSRLAKKSGISYATLHKLYVSYLERQSPHFTSKDIAEVLEISVRSANRLLQKLLDSGSAVIVSSVSLNGSGRPNRVVKIHF